MELHISHSTQTDRWIAAHHYLGCTPAGAVVRMEFYIDAEAIQTLAGDPHALISNNEKYLVGAMLWGRPTSRKIDQRTILELTRCVFLDFMPKNTESAALAKARAWIRKNMPEIKGVLAYASTSEKHRGTIYLADGWFKISETHSPQASWETRPGRRDRDPGVKYKFGRSP